MTTVLIRMAAVCGIVCLLVLSTTQCSKPETPPAETAAQQPDSILGGGSTPIDSSSFTTYKQSGTIRINSTTTIDLNTYKVQGKVAPSNVTRGNGDTMLISNGATVSSLVVSPWQGTGSANQPVGAAEQSTKVSITDPDPKP